MFFNLVVALFANLIFVIGETDFKKDEFVTKVNYLTDLTDDNWDQIQKGQWFIAFFDKETEESKYLYDVWDNDFALKVKKSNINVGRIFAPSNPALYVRFLVTVFPKVFYIKNGVAHEVPKPSTKTVLEMIETGNLSKLKPVNFLSNPFSVQLSLLSHLFVHAVNLYNYEHRIVQKFVSAPSATDAIFGLTFIVVGTFLGLLMTCLFGLFQIFMDSKEPEEQLEDEKKTEVLKSEKKEEEPAEETASVRKRKFIEVN